MAIYLHINPSPSYPIRILSSHMRKPWPRSAYPPSQTLVTFIYVNMPNPRPIPSHLKIMHSFTCFKHFTA